MPFDDIDLSAGLTSTKPEDDIDLSAGLSSPKPEKATAYDSNLLNFANEQGLKLVGDSASGRVPTGGHNKGSKHYAGQAIDVEHNGVDVDALSRAASARGFKLRDERTRPKGQKVWGGSHLHIEVDDGVDLSGGLLSPNKLPEIPTEVSISNPSVVSANPQRSPVTTPLVKPRVRSKPLTVQEESAGQFSFTDPRSGKQRYFDNAEDLNKALKSYGYSYKIKTAGSSGSGIADIRRFDDRYIQQRGQLVNENYSQLKRSQEKLERTYPGA